MAKPKGGFWVYSILLQHIASTFCMHSQTEISALDMLEVFHFLREICKKWSSSNFNVLAAPELPTGIIICHYVTHCDLFNTFE